MAAVLLTLVALLPVIVVVLTRWGSNYLPVQDSAVMDLRLRDVWTSDVPLTGAYSRYGWSHPGPWMYWLLAPFSLAVGQAAWATLVGAAALQGVAIAWTARLAWRAGGLPILVLWLAIGALGAAALGADAWLQPWNPHLAVPFFTLFLLQAWLVWRGQARQLIGAVVVGSFVVQTHVGYALIVAAVLIGAVVSVALDARREQRRLRDVAEARWSLVALLLVWLPVLLEPLVHRPGNLGEVARFFVTGGANETPVGLFEGAGLLASEFRVLPPWLRGTEAVDAVTRAAEPASLAWLLAPVALLAVAAVVAVRRHDRADVRAVALSCTVSGAAVLTLSRIAGVPFPYLFYWRGVVAVFLTLTALWIIAAGARVFDQRVVRGVWSATLAVVVVLASVGVAQEVADHPRSITPYERVTRQFVDELVAEGEPSGPVLVRFLGSALGGVHAGIVDELDRRDAPVLVDPGAPFAFGRSRTATPDEVDELWYVVEDGHALSLLTQRPGATVLVRTQPLSPEDEAELVERQRRVARQLRQSGEEGAIEVLSSTRVADTLGDVEGLDPVDLQRIDELNGAVLASGTCRCAVISFPATSPPQ